MLNTHMDIGALLEQRRAKDELFASSDHSPLDQHAQHRFEGLAYYEPNPELIFSLEVQPGDRSAVRIQTSDGQERIYRRAGTVNFEVGGEPARLTLYDTGHPGYFLPFRDKTSGEATYGAGRYLDLDSPEGGEVTIDFNLAYNPLCAYNAAYSCPLPPNENWLRVPIEAGELDYRS